MTEQEFIDFSLPYGLCVYLQNKTHLRLTKANYNTLIDNEKRIPILLNMNLLYSKSIWFNELEKYCCKELGVTNFYKHKYLQNIIWDYQPFFVIKWLIINHFDIVDLIETGEAIDVNTLETNPYK